MTQFESTLPHTAAPAPAPTPLDALTGPVELSFDLLRHVVGGGSPEQGPNTGW